MLPDDTRKKIKDIVAGIILEGQPDHCTAARNLLCRSYPTSTTVKEGFEGKAVAKKEQAEHLERFAKQHDLWIQTLPDKEAYLTEGGEARIYLDSDRRHVTKLNDGIYYATWLEFLNSILLHNFFPEYII